MARTSVTSDGARRAPIFGRHRALIAGWPAAVTAVVAIALQFTLACSFTAQPNAFDTPEGLYEVLNTAPYVAEATISGARWRVIDDPRLKVDHGYTCAGAPRAASKLYIGSRLIDSATLPTGFDATVMLNGWHLEYAGDDNQVVGLGAIIFNISRDGNELLWEAGGVLSDRRGNDEYRWCYEYTVVAWAKPSRPPIGGLPKAHIDMNAIHSDATGKLVFVDRKIDSNHFKTKSAKFKTAGAPPRGKLLAGFGISFAKDDHNLLQFGLDLGESTIKRKKIKWTTDVILKDNSDRSYAVGELATILTGESVEVWKPDAVLLEEGHPDAPGYLQNDLQLSPADDSNACSNTDETSHAYKFKVEGVPFTWAVPMLTGWEVGVFCSDEQVKKIGAWIEDFDWVRNPGDSTGTLTYEVRTILENKDADRGIFNGMQVEVLGINWLEPPGAEG
jgi:hypothetical protein